MPPNVDPSDPSTWPAEWDRPDPDEEPLAPITRKDRRIAESLGNGPQLEEEERR